MRNHFRSSIAIALFVASRASAQGSPALEAAMQAMGGKDRILAVRTLVLEGTGEQISFGQNQTPYAATKFEVTSYKASIDFANRRWFVDLTRVPRFVTANTNPQRQRTGLDGAPDGVAYNIGANDNMVRVGGQNPTTRMWEFLNHPIGFFQAAYRPGVAVTEEGVTGNERRVTISPMGTSFTMVIDRRTNLPLRLERRTYQAMLGDVPLVIDWEDYQDVSGIKVPMRLVQRYADILPLGRFQLTSTRIDADVGNIAATDSIRNVTVAQAGQPAPPTIAVDTLAPGVWRIAGGSHHTIAIEQSNQVVLVEAPQNDARTLAAIAKARELRPAKPVTLLINTHHHFDHSGGLRAAISQGLTIVTHEGNKQFYEKVVYPGVHASTPDALAQNPKPLRIQTVGNQRVLRDRMRTIEIHHVAGNEHNGNMLVVYLPAEKILVQADLYNPPAANAPAPPSFPFAANLLEMIRKKKLQVDRVVGIHGTPVSFADFQAAASRAP
jgi:glyoxylase-like metal-dependent hydrolase (beta-lactamase superfamily II)